MTNPLQIAEEINSLKDDIQNLDNNRLYDYKITATDTTNSSQIKTGKIHTQSDAEVRNDDINVCLSKIDNIATSNRFVKFNIIVQYRERKQDVKALDKTIVLKEYTFADNVITLPNRDADDNDKVESVKAETEPTQTPQMPTNVESGMALLALCGVIDSETAGLSGVSDQTMGIFGAARSFISKQEKANAELIFKEKELGYIEAKAKNDAERELEQFKMKTAQLEFARQLKELQDKNDALSRENTDLRNEKTKLEAQNAINEQNIKTLTEKLEDINHKGGMFGLGGLMIMNQLAPTMAKSKNSLLQGLGALFSTDDAQQEQSQPQTTATEPSADVDVAISVDNPKIDQIKAFAEQLDETNLDVFVALVDTFSHNITLMQQCYNALLQQN